MAHLRLLTVVVLAAVFSTGCGCALGPIWARRVEGRVVDKRTGEPVAGVEVFAMYDVHWAPNHTNIDIRWVTTDENGEFEIPGHVAVTLGPPNSSTARYPHFRVIHPDYGTDGFGYYGSAAADFPGWRSFEFEIEPNESLRLFENPHDWSDLCSGLSREACDRMCEVAYGSLEACYEGGRFPPELQP